jgi:hypothetical protein
MRAKVQFDLDGDVGLDDLKRKVSALCDRVAAEHGDVGDPQAGIEERREQAARDLPEVGYLDAASLSGLDRASRSEELVDLGFRVRLGDEQGL